MNNFEQNEIFDKYYKEWPYNLLKELFGDYKDVFTANLKGLMDAIGTLTEREQKAILYRFKDKYTYRKISEIEGRCSKEYSRQIIMKACRKLRHPSRTHRMFGFTYDEYETLRTEYDNLREVCVHLEKENKLLRDNINAIDDKLNIKLVIDGKLDYAKMIEDRENYLKSITIEELDLSVRAFNCLKRAGINTLYDLSIKTYWELTKVRNLGKRSLAEVIEAAAKYGVTIDSE